MSVDRHPWWAYVPPQRRDRLRRQVRRQRVWAWLRERRVRIGLALGVYLLLCLLPLLLGEPTLALVALLPVLLVPPVGYLAYRLTWLEFHR